MYIDDYLSTSCIDGTPSFVFADSLSRESYVTMIVCISPSNLDVVQTATTLKFAEEAKKIMSKPRLKELIDKYKVINFFFFFFFYFIIIIMAI
jgi:hypothetical protein